MFPFEMVMFPLIAWWIFPWFFVNIYRRLHKIWDPMKMTMVAPMMHPTGDMFSDARRVVSSLMTVAVCELENHLFFFDRGIYHGISD